MMKQKGPIITLLAGLLVAGVLFVLNMDLSNDTAKNAAARNAAANATATTSAAAQPTTPPAAPPTTAAPPGQGAAPSLPPAGKSTFAGAVDGGAAGLAIAVNNGRAVAYVCDGKVAEAWVAGAALNGQLTLSGAKGTLTATYANGVATGTVAAGTKRWHFTIKLASPPSGLYRSAAGVRNKLDASWAVTPDGKQYGIEWVNGVPGTARTLDTATNSADVNGTKVPVEPGNPDSPGN